MSDENDIAGKDNPDEERTVFVPMTPPSARPPHPEQERPLSADELGAEGPGTAGGWGAPSPDVHTPGQGGPHTPGSQGPEAPQAPQEWASPLSEVPPQAPQEWASPLSEAPPVQGIDPPPAAPPVPPPPSPPPPQATSAGLRTYFAPRTDGRSIEVGDVLNHIYEVKRFIARGGMGEVFEGCNVNSDEKVAIKVMLPSLAADPNVISMFRKEARTLTRLQHEALVQYRVLAQEPQLGVLYIVTEYVDGTNLADVIGQLNANADELAGLLRRLASGLRAAHALGAIHRDMSPDNVLLEGGRLSGAKIVDFGIAKDLDPGSGTIVGDGFAGKLNYVAPEQLGDFGREIGPWTDVYSLALVILAVAGGRSVNMGGSLVDAVDKRRAGPDLSAAPESLRPVLEAMLRPNPADRLRTMDDVLALLDQTRAPPAPSPVAASSGLPKPALFGGAAALVVALGAAAWLMLGTPEERPKQVPGGSVPAVVGGDPVEAATAAINSAIPSIPCSWLDVVNVRGTAEQVDVRMTGVANSPAQAQNHVSRALEGAGLRNPNINFEEVATIQTAGCAALDAYRQLPRTDVQRLSVSQRRWEMRMQEEGAAYAGKKAANVIVKMNVGEGSSPDFTLFGMEPSGIIQPIIRSRAEFEGELQKGSIDKDPDGSYKFQVDVDHAKWSGVVLLMGRGPFPTELTQPNLGARGPDWVEKLVTAAGQQGWQAEMLWFETFDPAGDTSR